jgi:hypothetical protein
VLTAALALVALPGLVGSRAPSPIETIPGSAFQSISGPANASRSIAIGGLDPAYASASAIDGEATFVEPATAPEAGVTSRGSLDQPDPAATTVRRQPRLTLSGEATFYDNGTTAMRLPRGTRVVICGRGGCIERVVNDYGPQKKSRVVDLYRPDFFRICGCGWYAGTTKVTVSVY